MRSARLIRVFVLGALICATAVAVSAQNVALPATAPGQISVSLGGPSALAGAPYTATRKTTRVQTLANGTTVTHITTVKEARDSQGRTYRETQLETLAAATGQPMIHYFVFDPVARTTMNWSSGGQQVILNHLPEPHPVPRVQNRVEQPSRLTSPPVRPAQSDIQTENLGTKSIDGIEAVGRRTTRTIPAGQEGNDQPIVVTHEIWTSPELHISVQQTDDDPRSGTTTMELTDIDRNEPDPRLFQAPEGYTVREIEPAQSRLVDTNP